MAQQQRAIAKGSPRRRFVVHPPEVLFRRERDAQVVRLCKEKFVHTLQRCLADDLKALNFETSYRAAYSLTLHKEGTWVLGEALRALRLLNLQPLGDARYAAVAKAIEDICMYPSKTTAVDNKLEPLAAAALRLRSARGPQLWRLLVAKWAAGLARVDLWKARIAEWRLAFDAVAFRPEGGGAEAARRNFAALAGARAL